MRIKDEPELQHVLAHMLLALDALRKGRTGAARYHLRSVESLVWYNGNRDLEEHMAKRCTMKNKKGGKKAPPFGKKDKAAGKGKKGNPFGKRK